jgi:hypothetical protein
MMRRSLNNRPLRSVLANRKLFQGGGMVGMGNPMAMANMQPAGILASSPNLINAVANDAINPQGGPTLSMADGGIAKFHEGGSVHRHPHPVEIGLGAPPEAIVSRAMGEGSDQTEQGRAESMFARSNRYRGRLLDASRIQPYSDYVDPEASPIEGALGGAWGTIDRGLAALTQANQDVGEFIGDTAESLFERGPGSALEKHEQITAVNDALRRQPNVTGVSSEEVSSLIKTTAKDMIDENSSISGDDLLVGIANAVYKISGELPLAAGIMRGRPLEDRTAEGLPATAEDVMAEILMAEGPADVVEEVVEPEASTEVAAEEVAPDESVDQMIARVSEESPSKVAEPSTNVPPGQTAEEIRESERVAAALDVKDAFNTDTSKNQKDAQTSLEDYLEEFRKAVPDYEGKSEWEKGMDIVKMGMAIAAGESQHAITNIAKGVMATIDNFTSDDKERRAYERQVGLSAGKYALDSVERDRVRRDALLKEGRVLTQAIALEDFVDPQGNEIKKGEAYPVTRTQIDQGIFQSLPLTYTNVFIENARSIKAFEAAQATAVANLRKEKIIGYEEAHRISETLRGAREDFVHAEAGEALLSGVIEQLVLNPDDITGAEGAATKFVSDTLNFLGQGEDKSEKYKTRELLELDMKMAFQELIPVALRNIQAGNSISDRDVKNLANAFIAGGFINQNDDGTFAFNTELAGKNPEVLVRQLQQTIKIFRNAQQNSLVTFEQELYNLSQAEAGRHDIRYFEPELKRMAPAIEAYRLAQEGKTRGVTSPATRMEAPSVLQVSDYFDLATGKSIKPIPRWVEEGS